MLLAVALGGMLGASGRYLIGEAWPPAPGGMPWSTLTIDLTGSLAPGVLMTAISLRPAAALLAPVPRHRRDGRLNDLFHLRAVDPPTAVEA